MVLTPIHSDQAPQALGPYSQAIRVGDLVFLSGQIGLIPQQMILAEGGVGAQAHQVFRNLQAVADAAGTSLAKAVKLSVFLTDIEDFREVNDVMSEYCLAPYPARSTLQVAALPKNAAVEIEAVLAL